MKTDALDFDLVIVDDVLTLLLFKQDKDPHEPALYHYPELHMILLERSAVDKHQILLTDESNEYLKQYSMIHVVEMNPEEGQEEDVISYMLEVQTLVSEDADPDQVMKSKATPFSELNKKKPNEVNGDEIGFSGDVLKD